MRTPALFFSSAAMVLAACGFRAGDYEPVLDAGVQQAAGWNTDLIRCHKETVESGVSRSEYGGSIDRCMTRAGHAIDLEASAEKFRAMEIERKRIEVEKAEKLRGY